MVWRRTPPANAAQAVPSDPPGGRIVTVWGPTGAPGVSTVAAALAGALGSQPELTGHVALIDANLQRGALEVLLGRGVDTAVSGNIIAACRFSPPPGRPCAPLQEHRSGFHLLPGVPGPTQNVSVEPEALTALLERLRRAYEWVIVDVGWALPEHECGRAHWAALAAADLVLVVAAATRLGVVDLVQQYPALATGLLQLVHQPDIWAILNRGGGTQVETWRRSIRQELCLPVYGYVPWDRAVAVAEQRYLPVTVARPHGKAGVVLWSVAERVARTPARRRITAAAAP